MSNDVLEKLTRLQQKMVQRLDKPDSDRKFSVVYTNVEGVIKFRPYLDKDGELVRTGFKHSYKGRSVNCVGRDCEVCKRVKELTDSWKGVWVYGSREYAIMYGWIFETSIPVGRHMKIGEVVLLEGQSQFANKVSFHFKEINDPNDLLETFSPSVPSLMWQISSQKIKGRWNISLGYHNKKGTMPELPDDFPPLTECSFREGQESPPDKIAEFIQEIDENHRKYLSLETSKSPDVQQTISNDRLPSSITETENPVRETSRSNVVNERVDPPASGKFTGTRVAAQSPDEKPACYGNHAGNFEDTECLLCKVEPKCEADSLK
jgi:hypothetical protein